jgi:hypothetical protein
MRPFALAEIFGNAHYQPSARMNLWAAGLVLDRWQVYTSNGA